MENYFSFEVLKKKNWAHFQRIIELFTQKNVTKLSKNIESNKQNKLGKNLFLVGILEVTEEKSKIRIRIRSKM
jgi:hypothetical protein